MIFLSVAQESTLYIISLACKTGLLLEETTTNFMNYQLLGCCMPLHSVSPFPSHEHMTRKEIN